MSYLIPLLILGIALFGHIRGVDIYEAFIRGAKNGLKSAVSVFPYLAAMLVALSLLNASGALELLTRGAASLLSILAPQLPADALPMALLRPLSGSGALALLSEIFRTLGPDSRAGWVAACIMGSSETIFYTLALYCGHVGIKKARYALPVSLIAAAIAAIAAFCMVLE